MYLPMWAFLNFVSSLVILNLLKKCRSHENFSLNNGAQANVTRNSRLVYAKTTTRDISKCKLPSVTDSVPAPHSRSELQPLLSSPPPTYLPIVSAPRTGLLSLGHHPTSPLRSPFRIFSIPRMRSSPRLHS